MTIIEVLEWLLKAKKAGFDYVLVDYQGQKDNIEVLIKSIDGYAWVISPNLDVETRLLSNPRLPQMDKDKQIESLRSELEYYKDKIYELECQFGLRKR